MGGSNTLFRRIPSYDFVYGFLSAAVIDKLLYLVARHHVVDDSCAVCRVVVQLELEAELNHIVNGLFRNVQFDEIVPVDNWERSGLSNPPSHLGVAEDIGERPMRSSVFIERGERVGGSQSRKPRETFVGHDIHHAVDRRRVGEVVREHMVLDDPFAVPAELGGRRDAVGEQAELVSPFAEPFAAEYVVLGHILAVVGFESLALAHVVEDDHKQVEPVVVGNLLHFGERELDVVEDSAFGVVVDVRDTGHLRDGVLEEFLVVDDGLPSIGGKKDIFNLL